MTSWSLKNLSEAIKTDSSVKANEALELIRSISNSLDIFEYHYRTALELIEKHHAESVKDASEVFFNTLRIDDVGQEYRRGRIVIHANCIGAALTLRAMYDIFAQLVRELFKLKNNRNWNINDVSKNLISTKQQSLADNVRKITKECPNYDYLKAFTNVSKHRFIVLHHSHFDLVDYRAGVRFADFTYNSTKYDACWSNDFLAMLADLLGKFIELGVELNRLYIKDR